jgi:hypothetical protein
MTNLQEIARIIGEVNDRDNQLKDDLVEIADYYFDRVGDFFGSAWNWTRGHAEATITMLKITLIGLAVVMLGGLIIKKVGWMMTRTGLDNYAVYGTPFEWVGGAIMWFGSLVMALGTIIALTFLGWFAVRTGFLGAVLHTAFGLGERVVEDVSQRVPLVPNLELPTILSREDLGKLMTGIMAALTWVAMIGVILNDDLLLPVYVDIIAVLHIVIIVFFLAFGKIGWGFAGQWLLYFQRGMFYFAVAKLAGLALYLATYRWHDDMSYFWNLRHDDRWFFVVWSLTLFLVLMFAVGGIAAMAKKGITSAAMLLATAVLIFALASAFSRDLTGTIEDTIERQPGQRYSSVAPAAPRRGLAR